MKTSSLLFAAVAAAAPQALSPRQETPNVMIDVISATPSGTGCPPGSYAIEYSAPDPDWNPNKSGFVIGFDEPFFVPLRSDAADLDKNLRAGRDCNVLVKIRYPVGCSTTTVIVASNGIHQNDVDAQSSFSRSFALSTGTRSNPGTLTFGGGEYFGAPGIVFKQQDYMTGEARISEGMQDATLSIDMSTEVWSGNRTALDWSYIKMDDFTTFFTVEEYSASC